ncbi:hypothetical protein LUZ60_007001 [Juncus effusus]|nr:hypothetical protein LUZ60_007001 [Juncus effusus]
MKGKIVMVTGASSGIGRDLCIYLVKNGCRVVAAARRVERLRSLCDQLNGSDSPVSDSLKAKAVELDVTASDSQIEAVVKRAWDAFGQIDALVNNAGVRGGVYSPLEWPEEEWNKLINTNLTGSWLVTKHVCKLMHHAGLKGSVVNISSIVGLHRGQLPGGVAYTASKAAVNAITEDMALELGPYQIRVNSISPGIFRSEITEGLMHKPWLSNVARRTVPLQTFGATDPALTSVVKYLIDDSSEYVSGNIFIVDAGATLPGIRPSADTTPPPSPSLPSTDIGKSNGKAQISRCNHRLLLTTPSILNPSQMMWHLLRRTIARRWCWNL